MPEMSRGERSRRYVIYRQSEEPKTSPFQLEQVDRVTADMGKRRIALLFKRGLVGQFVARGHSLMIYGSCLKHFL